MTITINEKKIMNLEMKEITIKRYITPTTKLRENKVYLSVNTVVVSKLFEMGGLILWLTW